MSRLTLIIFVLVFLVVGYVTYIAQLGLAESKKRKDELKELAVELAQSRSKTEALVSSDMLLFFQKRFQALQPRMNAAMLTRESAKLAQEFLARAHSLVLGQSSVSQRQFDDALIALREAESLLVPPPQLVPTLSEVSATAARPGVYRVRPGETLWGISKKLYNTPWQWYKLWKINEAKLPNYRKLAPGLLLRLPS